MIHKNKISCKECFYSTQRLCAKCAKENKVIIEKCHAGLTEVIAPLVNGVTVIGYIMFGQITTEPDKELFAAEVKNRCKEYGLNNIIIDELLAKVLYYSDKQLSDASKILDAIAKYIVLDKLVYPLETTVAYEITEYIRNNLDKKITVEELCKKYYLSRNQIYKITNAYMPNGIGGFIREERIAKASAMLAETKKTNWEIALETGFADVNYFLRVFKKEKGISASAYRKKHEKY
jgi:AraC-like DNA-binding protein